MIGGHYRLYVPIREAVTLTLIVAGGFLWVVAQRPSNTRFEDLIGTSYADKVVWEHNQATGTNVHDISELTEEEILTAVPKVMERNFEFCQAEMTRIRLAEAAAWAAVGCWLVASLLLLVRRSPIPVGDLHKSSQSTERHSPSPPIAHVFSDPSG